MKCSFKLIAVTSLIFVLSGPLLGQDGSNMRYVKPSELTGSDLGKWVHLDFGKSSFAIVGTERQLDAVGIEIKGKSVRFQEHRQDDGLNNWYECQYLETTKKVDGRTLRISRNKLLAFDQEMIRIEAFFDWFAPSGNKIQGKSFKQELTFRKDTIAEVLVRVGEDSQTHNCWSNGESQN